MTDVAARRMTDVALKALPRPGVDFGIGALGLLCGVVAFWSTTGVNPTEVGDGGLAPVLPPIFWVAVVGLNLAFVLSLGRRVSSWLSPTLVAGLVLLLYAPAGVVGEVPRNAVSWRHLGVADAMANGVFNPRIDVYFNWPGFFPGLATFVHATGLPPLQVAAWAPVVNIALWSLGVVAVLRALTRDKDAILLPLWLFLIGNWIDQDYLSPQALGFLLHLVILALALCVLGATVQGGAPGWRGFWRVGTRVPEHDDGRLRRLTLGVVLLLSVALVSSHQLTPVVLAFSLLGLVVVRRSWAPLLPAILGLLVVLWMLYPASTYLIGHPVFASDQAGVVQANLTGRIVGSPGHLAIQEVRIALTIGLWVLAAVGMAQSWRAGRRDLRPYVLAIVPFLMLPILNYGGEMLLRVTLFSLPFVAFFAARPLASLRPRWPRRAGKLGLPSTARALVLTLLLSVLCAASVTARYGNAHFDTFTDKEVKAVGALGRLAPVGSVIVSGAASTPWASQDYSGYTRRSVQSLCEVDFAPAACVQTLRDLADHEASTGGITLLLTRGNQASLEMQGQMSDDEFVRFEAGIRDLAGTRLLFANRDARIYHLGPVSRTPTRE
ncbi:MAG: glycosyltransferase [Nocardioides sp.]|nr:glycosyltransferase [Nocardioides sp.]